MPRYDDDYDDDDDRPRRPRRRTRDYDDDDDDDEEGSTAGEAASIIVPYRNGMALASYYCGIFGLIPFLGLLLGPIAFILGIRCIRKTTRTPMEPGTPSPASFFAFSTSPLLLAQSFCSCGMSNSP